MQRPHAHDGCSQNASVQQPIMVSMQRRSRPPGSGTAGMLLATAPIILVAALTIVAAMSLFALVVHVVIGMDTSTAGGSSSSSSRTSTGGTRGGTATATRRTIPALVPALSSHQQHEQLPTSNNHNLNPLLRALGYSSDQLFETLLMHGLHTKQPHLTVIEVGAHRLRQSTYAAECGFNVITFDASPQNFAEMEKEWKELKSKEQRDRIKMYNRAVGRVSGEILKFSSAGGTGDHVDGMTLDEAEGVKYNDNNDNSDNSNRNAKSDGGGSTSAAKSAKKVVSVETVALDDVIQSLPPERWVYLVKIDVQGYEANVFRGMSQTLATGKIRYILFEYWVDALDQTAGLPLGSCSGVTDILIPLADAGYQLFDLSLQNHPKGQGMRPNRKESRFGPLEFTRHCLWLHRKSQDAREEIHYSMGYWTDVLAVYGGDFQEGREYF